jgi:predicted RNase H-like HicB family nuclease
MTYKVVLYESEEGFSVHCPDLPGCWSQGATEEEALANIRDAVREYLAELGDGMSGEVEVVGEHGIVSEALPIRVPDSTSPLSLPHMDGAKGPMADGVEGDEFRPGLIDGP